MGKEGIKMKKYINFDFILRYLKRLILLYGIFTLTIEITGTNIDIRDSFCAFLISCISIAWVAISYENN